MTNFADSLFEDLMEAHGAELAASAAAPSAGATRRRYTRPAWATVGTVAAAGAAAVGFTVFGSTASAYAVTDNHDGTVTVSVTKAGGIAGANAKLHQMGASVVVMKATPGCPSIQSFATPGQTGGKTRIGLQNGPSGPTTVTVQAKDLPKNDTMLIAFEFGDGKGQLASVLTAGPVPSCVSLPAAPPPGAVVSTGSGGGNGSGLHTESGSGAEPALSQQTG